MLDLLSMKPEEALQVAVDGGLTQTARLFAQIVKANSDRADAIKVLNDLVRALANKNEPAIIESLDAATKFLDTHRG